MRVHSVIFAVVLLSIAGGLGAQDSYQVPAKELVAIVDAPAPASVLAGPKEWMLLGWTPTTLTIADLSQPELRLAGYRFNPLTREQTRAQYAVEHTPERIDR